MRLALALLLVVTVDEPKFDGKTRAEWLVSLKDGSVERIQAAESLAVFGRDGLDALFEACRSSDVDVRRWAAHGVTELGPEAHDRVGDIEALLAGESDAYVASELNKALLEIGKPGIAALERLLASESFTARTNAASTLMEHAPEKRDVATPAFREGVVQGIESLEGNDEVLAYYVAWLMRIDGALATLAGGGNQTKSALETIRKLAAQDENTLDALDVRLDPDDVEARRRLAKFFEANPSLPGLEDVLAHPPPDAELAATLEGSVDLSSDYSLGVSLKAVRALATLAEPGREALQRLAKTEHPTLGLVARYLLDGGEENQRRVIALLSHDTYHVREWASEEVASMGPVAIPHLAKILETDRTNVTWICGTLRRMAAEEGLPLLERIYREENDVVRSHVMWAWTAIAPRDEIVFSRLQDLRRHPNRSVRKDARRTLRAVYRRFPDLMKKAR